MTDDVETEYGTEDQVDDAHESAQAAVGRISGRSDMNPYAAAAAGGARAAGRVNHQPVVGGPMTASPRAAWQPGTPTPVISSADAYPSCRPRNMGPRPDHTRNAPPKDLSHEPAAMNQPAYEAGERAKNTRVPRSAADLPASARHSDVEALKAENADLRRRLEALEGRK